MATVGRVKRKSTRRKTSPAADGLKIGYIGGGSVHWAHVLMSDLAMCPQMAGEVRLYDVIPERARMNARYGTKLYAKKEVKSSWTWKASRTLKAAIEGANFVFLSITPGQLEAFAREMEIAERHGIHMTVGDTVGPTGYMRGLRAARLYAGFAKAIAEHAPNAWVVNYTNPMTICTQTLSTVAPGIKVFGCCHEVFGTQKHLAGLVEKYLGDKEPPRDEIEVDVTGLNHFTWLTRATWKGHDLRTLWDRNYRENNSLRPRHKADELEEQSVFGGKDCVKYALAERFGPLAAAGDRHLVEFVPGFLKSPDEIARWGLKVTRVREFRIPKFNENLDKTRSKASGKLPIEIETSGEEAVRQMMAIVGLGDLKTNVNLPNTGQIDDLPRGSVVETNALFTRDRVTPLSAGPLPASLTGLMNQHATNQRRIVEAALEADEDKAIATIALDPVNTLPLDETASMVREMIEATEPWSYPVEPPK